MKFHCDYCRELIDTEKDKKCPSCGATYKDNKEYKKLLEEQAKQKEQIKEQQEFVQKQIKRIGITGGVFAIIIPIIAFAIMGTIIFIGVKEEKKNNNKFDKEFNDLKEKIQSETSEEEINPIMVNEEKSSKNYKVKLEKYRFLKQKDNTEHDKLEVTLVVEKISDDFMANGENIYCIVNNVSQDYIFSESDTIIYIKDKNIPETRKMTYNIPKGTEEFDIKYGNEVSFHVNIENN